MEPEREPEPRTDGQTRGSRNSYLDKRRKVRHLVANLCTKVFVSSPYSMHLGNEVFDVTKQPLQGDFNHLFIRQGTGLQGQAVFRTKMSFRPHSTDSFTHQKMTRSMADRSTKKSGIKIISQIGSDPDANRYARVKKEEERLRMDLRRESLVKRTKEGASKRNLSTGYLEGGDR